MYVASVGMVCSVGLNAAAACAAMRAGIAKFEELPYLDQRVEPIIGAAVPGLDEGLRRHERLLELLSMALADLIAQKGHEPLEHVPLFVGLAEPPRPGGGAEVAESIIGQLQEHLGVRFHPSLSHVILEGHTSGFRALWLARELLRTRQVPACLVSGVDSYVNSRSLQWLEQYHRLKTDENADGVIPGEAAAAVLLLPASDSATDAMMQVAGLGFGYEKASVLSDVPLLGLGLTEAAQAALNDAGLQMHDIDFRMSDVTGEQYGFKEQLLALARLLRRRRHEFPIWHCSEYIGDIGAAAGMCQLVVAFYASQKAYAPGSYAMCYTSSVPGDRGVAILKGLNSSSRSVSEEL